MKKSPRNNQTLIIAACLAVLTVVAYLPVFRNGFIQFFDDGSYIVRNTNVHDGLTGRSIAWAFTSIYNANWHPLTWISHMLDYSLYGPDPTGHHTTNLLLHTANTVLLFLLLRKLTRSEWKSAFAAALFAVHPLHVESVAWAAERKDVLSTFFWILTMWAYARYTENPVARRYALVLLTFVLGLMSKPMLVTLPFTLLLMDYWPLRRCAAAGKPRFDRRLVMEKLPLLALSIASSVVTYIAQQRGGATVTFREYPLGVRVANAIVAYPSYMLKMLWPGKLALLYPHPQTSLPVWEVIGAALLLAGISFVAIRASGRRPYLAFGWLWFIGTLVPVIGLVQVGGQAIADRYTYVPLIGLFIIIAWGVPDIVGKGESKVQRSTSNVQRFHASGGTPSAGGATSKGKGSGPFKVGRSTLDVGRSFPRQSPNTSPVLAIVAALVIAALTACTWVQAGYWKDDVTLFEHSISVTTNNSTMHGNLGSVYYLQGDYGKAILNLAKAVSIEPDSADLHMSYGHVLFAAGKVDEAVKQLSEAQRLNRNLPPVMLKELQTAKEKQREGGGIDPVKYQAAVALFNEGVILDGRGESAQAMAKYKEAIKLAPKYADPYVNLAGGMYSQSDTDQAIVLCRKAIALKPDFGFAHKSMAIFMFVKGKYAESWHEVHAADKYGYAPNPDFVQMLASKMPDPGK